MKKCWDSDCLQYLRVILAVVAIFDVPCLFDTQIQEEPKGFLLCAPYVPLQGKPVSSRLFTRILQRMEKVQPPNGSPQSVTLNPD